MSTARRVARNTSFLFLGEVISRLLRLVLFVFIARYLGDVGLGKYTFAFAFTSLFLVASDLGLSYLSIREIARDTSRARKYLGNISVVKAILSLITIALIVLVINLMDYPRDTTLAVYIAAIIVVFTSFSQLFRSIFRAFERMEYEMITRIAESVLVVGTGLTVLLLGHGLIGLVLAILGAQVLTSLFSLAIVVKKFARPELTFDMSFSKQLIKSALPIGLGAVFMMIYFQIDTVMLSIMKGDAVVGWYNAAYHLVFALMFIPGAFIGSIFPIMSKYFVSSGDSLKWTYEKSFKYLLILALPLGIGATLVADKVISLLYGAAFANSVIALQILIWAGSLMFLTWLAGNTFVSINKAMVSTVFLGICAALNVILNLILIPRYSYIGAAAATVITELVAFVLHYYYLHRYLHHLPMHKLVLKPLAAGLLMGLLVYYLGTVASLFIVVPVAIILYGALLYLFKTFDTSDLTLMRDIVKPSIR